MHCLADVDLAMLFECWVPLDGDADDYGNESKRERNEWEISADINTRKSPIA